MKEKHVLGPSIPDEKVYGRWKVKSLISGRHYNHCRLLGRIMLSHTLFGGGGEGGAAIKN